MSFVSLLDHAGPTLSADWYVIYTVRSHEHWWVRWLKPGFEHCFVARPVYYGNGLTDCFWLYADPCAPMLNVGVEFSPVPPWQHNPRMTVQKVHAVRPLYKLREPFMIGPPSCVEVVKSCLGIRSWWIRTPWQLYKYIRARGGLITQR